MPERICKACLLTLPIDKFRPQSNRPGLWHHTCRRCDNAQRAARRREEAALRPPKPPQIEKRCTACGLTKPVAEFNKNRSGRARPNCKVCQQVAYKDYVARNREKVSKSTRSYHYKRRFGKTLAEVEAILRSVSNRCESCGMHKNETYNQRLVLDHDHACCPGENTCGQCIRGVLCTKCNVALGALDDIKSKVQGLFAYAEGRL